MNPYSTELCHHGILGQRWGKKNGPPYPLGSEISTGSRLKETISNNKMIKNSDGSITFKKGFKFNRVGNEDLKPNNSGGLYVSYGKADASRYVKALGPTLIGKLMNEYGTTIQHLTVNNNIKCISENKLINESIHFLKNNPKYLNEVGDSFYSLVFDDLKIDNNSINSYNDTQKKQLNYLLNSLLADPNYSSMSKEYYSWIRNKGYDAIPDIHDKLSGTGETSTIIINPNKVTMTSKTEISKDVMKEAKKFVKSIEDLPIDELLK